MLKTIHLELSKINIQENLITSSKNKFHILGFLQRKKFFFAFLARTSRSGCVFTYSLKSFSHFPVVGKEGGKGEHRKREATY